MTHNDYVNLLQIVRRGTYAGLDEAAVAVQLAHKLQLAINTAQAEQKKLAEKAPD